MFDNILSNPVFMIAGPIFGFIGIILAIIFHLRNKREKIPNYYINSYNVISDKLKNKVKDIEIFFKKGKIQSLTVSKIVIWNAGNETIWKKDIPKTNKFIITTDKEYEIYDFEIISLDDEDVQLNLEKINNKIEINFEYLEPQKGFIIKVTHSGHSSKCLTLSGKVIGGTNLKKKNSLSIDNSDSYIYKLYRAMFPNFGKRAYRIFSILLTLFMGTVLISGAILSTNLILKIFLLFFGSLYVLLVFIQIFARHMPKQLYFQFFEN